MKDNIVEACAVFWGEWLDPDLITLQASDNPEQNCILMETIENLSLEAKLVLSVIINMPDEVFTKTGRVIQHKFEEQMKNEFGWSIHKIRKVQHKLLLSFS
jgi:hypothetical protein